MKAEIKKIVLDLEGKEITLSPEQAKKLYELLDEMYGKKEVEYRHYPIYIDKYPWRPYWTYDKYTWCSSSNDVTMSYNENDCTAKLSL